MRTGMYCERVFFEGEEESLFWSELKAVNPLTLMNDQDRISPNNIYTTSTR